MVGRSVLSQSSRQSCKQFRNCRIVAKRLTQISEAIYVPEAEDKAGPQLKRIFAQAVLALTGSARPFSGSRVVTAEYMQKGRAGQSRCSVGSPVFVDEQRKCDSTLLAKQSRIVHVAKTDRSQTRSFLFKFLLVRAQLRDVLTAKNSAVMTKEYDHCGTALPQRAEANLISFAIREHNVGEIATESHGAEKLSSSEAGRARDLVDLCGENEIAFCEAVDLVRPDRHCNLAPAQENVGMMALLFGDGADGLHEFQSADEIGKVKAFLDVMLFNHFPARQLPRQLLKLLSG
jgi:hypothetical protein